MTNIFPNKVTKSLFFLVALALPTWVGASQDICSSQLVNQSKHSGTNGFKLVKTKVWPNSMCVIDSGQQIVNPGESTNLKIKKAKECSESGVGYSIYKLEDTKNEHLLGYLSHRLGDGKFSVQVSRFCEGKQCVFMDLNPAQSRD